MAQPLSGLLVRTHQDLVSTIGGSQEVDFDIPRSLAIEIFGASVDINIVSLVATPATQGATFLDLDGPGLASDAIATLVAYDLRKLLDSAVIEFSLGADAVTTGGAQTRRSYNLMLPQPILTARNPGIALGAAAATVLDVVWKIYYRWVRITDQEFVSLVANLRS